MQYKRGQFVGNHGLSYTITNLTMVAIWRSNGFRIHPLIAEKKTTLLFQGTFGHTVGVTLTWMWRPLPGSSLLPCRPCPWLRCAAPSRPSAAWPPADRSPARRSQSEININLPFILGPKLLLAMGCVKLSEKFCVHLPSVGEQTAN